MATHPPAASHPRPRAPAAARPADPRPRALLLTGVPDNRRVTLRWTGWDQQPAIIFPGTASFLNQMREPPLSLANVCLGGRRDFDVSLPRVPTVNFMADADVYPTALQQAADLVQHLGTPSFNAPQAVLRTGRDAVAQALADVPGLWVPRTVRVVVQDLAALRAAVRDAGLTLPVLVRPAGAHNGDGTALITDDTDWSPLGVLAWIGRPLYLTQWVDFADADGLYRKLRLVVVGDRIFARHHIVAAGWMVHRRDRVEGHDDVEAAFVRDFDRDWLPRLGAPVRAIAQRLGLDFFGIDASLRPDGRLLIFEANASMNVLLRPRDGAAWVGPHVDSIQHALHDWLATPARWRHPGRGGARAAASAAPDPVTEPAPPQSLTATGVPR